MPGGDTDQLIWLSDLHFVTEGPVSGHDPRLRVTAAVDHIIAHYPAARLCMITGDMVDEASPENYSALRTLLDRLPMPWAPMTGNHDGRALFLDHMPLPETAMRGFAQYVQDLPQARLICLDSLNEGHASGYLCDRRLAWLDEVLDEMDAQPEKHIMVFLHHPPVPLGLPMQDPDRLRNGAALLERLRRFRGRCQVFCGHVHRPVTAMADGLPVTSLRAVLYQAPPPVPAWDWDSFHPPREAPGLGVITARDGQITVRSEQFCGYELGGAL